MIDFGDFCSEIFQILRAYGRDLVLYDEAGNRVYEPTEARRFYMLGENILLSIQEDGDNSSLKLYLSNSVNLDQANGFISMLRNLTTKSNLLFHVKKFDKEIKPQDFATRASVNEQENLNMNLMEGLYGTSKSSYLKLESARMIVRHSAKVNENMIGSRGRNIQAIFVENVLGERFLFPVNMLSGGRAMTQHVNQGGSFADEVGQQIIRMAQDFRNLARVQQHGKTDAVAQPEVYASVQESILEGMKAIKRSFGRVYEAKSYGRETGRITESSALMEDDEAIATKVEAWTTILGEGVEQEAILSLARLVQIPEVQTPVVEDFADEVDSDDDADDADVENSIDLTVEGTTEQEALECSENHVIKEFNDWMESFDPDSFLEGKTFKDNKDQADVGRKKKADKERRQERDAKRQPVEEAATQTMSDIDIIKYLESKFHDADLTFEFQDAVDDGMGVEFMVSAANEFMANHGVDLVFTGAKADGRGGYIWTLTSAPVTEGKTFKHDDDDDGSDPKGKKKQDKKKREEQKSKRERTDEDGSLELWKSQVKAAHPEVAGKLKFKGRNEDGKTLVSAEIEGEDRSYGVFDMGDEKGEVLEGKLKEFDMGDEGPSVHDLKSQLMAADIKLRSLSPFSPDYGKTLMFKQDLEAKLKGTSRYGRPVAENMFPDNDDDYDDAQDDVSDLIAKYSNDGYQVRRVPQHELNNANMYATVYRVWDLQANKMLGTVRSEADGWRLIDQHVKDTGGIHMEGTLNEFELDLDSDDDTPEDGNVHDIKSQLAQTQADLSKMNAFNPMYGKVMQKRDELQSKLKGMSRYGKAVTESPNTPKKVSANDIIRKRLGMGGRTQHSGRGFNEYYLNQPLSGADLDLVVKKAEALKNAGLVDFVELTDDNPRVFRIWFPGTKEVDRAGKNFEVFSVFQYVEGQDEFKINGATRKVSEVSEDWADGDLMGEDDAVFTDEEEGLTESSEDKLIRDDGWFQIDAEVMLDDEDMADYEAQFADLGYLIDRDYEWSIAGGDDMPDGIIVRSDAMRADREVRALLGEIHGPGAYANFDDEEDADDEDEDEDLEEAHIGSDRVKVKARHDLSDADIGDFVETQDIVTIEDYDVMGDYVYFTLMLDDVSPEVKHKLAQAFASYHPEMVEGKLPTNQQKDFKRDVVSRNNDDQSYVTRMAQLAGLKR